MKCVVCDRCKDVIKDPRKGRVITCARPLRLPKEERKSGCPSYRGDDRQMNDIIWEKEICPKCLEEFEAFIEAGKGEDNPSGGGTTGGCDCGSPDCSGTTWEPMSSNA